MDAPALSNRADLALAAKAINAATPGQTALLCKADRKPWNTGCRNAPMSMPSGSIFLVALQPHWECQVLALARATF